MAEESPLTGYVLYSGEGSFSASNARARELLSNAR